MEGLMTAEKCLGKWAFEVPPEKVPEAEVKDTVTAEVVVIGAGTAGLITANSAMDEGLDVVLITGSDRPISRGGSNAAAFSKTMKEAGYGPLDPWYVEKEILANGNMVDQKKWYKWYNHSEEAFNYVIDYMESKGYQTALEQGNHMKEHGLHYSPVISHGWAKDIRAGKAGVGQTSLVNEFADRFVQGGGRLIFKMAGYYFEKDGDRVIAVIARDLENGGYVRYKGTKAVVIAAGDFSKDKDMMAKYVTPYVDCVREASYNSPEDYNARGGNGIFRGDMLKAALWAGAAWQKSLPNCVMLSNFSNGAVVSRYQNFPGLLLDADGERFMNEYCSRAFGPVTQHLNKKGLSWAIWDSDWYDHFTWYDVMKPDQYKDEFTYTREQVMSGWDSKADGSFTPPKMFFDAEIKGPQWFKADTIEELVEKAGLPPKALETIKNYNRMCHEGRDTEYHKDPDFMIPVEKGPFYCHKEDFTHMNLFTVLGGPRTNSNMQVCDEKDDPIPGLYIVGTGVGDMFAGHYTFMTEGACYGACCITFGYLTGKYIAENE